MRMALGRRFQRWKKTVERDRVHEVTLRYRYVHVYYSALELL